MRDPRRAPMTPERRERMPPDQEVLDRNHSHGSPDFGGGVGYHRDDAQKIRREAQQGKAWSLQN